MKAVVPWLAGLAAVAAVAGAAWAGWTYFPPPSPAAAAAPAAPDPFAPVERAGLKPGHDYVVLIRAVEVAPTGPGGKTWERGFEDGPDLAYDLTWRGNVIFTSSVADDALIGRWEALNVDLMDTLQSGGDVDLGKALNNGAVIRTPPAPAPQADGSAVAPAASVEPLRVRVWDSDLFDNDEAGTVYLDLADLAEGDTELAFDGGEAGAVRRLSVRVTDREVPVRNLLEVLRAP